MTYWGVVMETQSLIKLNERMPGVIDDFFKPWNEWFDGGSLWGKTMIIPAVKITEQKNEYLVSLAVPGMKKNDFTINVDGNMLTISCKKEENKEEKEKKYPRKEYNYSSFSRSFTLPEEINREKIDVKYEEGVLKIILPRKEDAKKSLTKIISIT